MASRSPLELWCSTVSGGCSKDAAMAKQQHGGRCRACVRQAEASDVHFRQVALLSHTHTHRLLYSTCAELHGYPQAKLT